MFQRFVFVQRDGLECVEKYAVRRGRCGTGSACGESAAGRVRATRAGGRSIRFRRCGGGWCLDSSAPRSFDTDERSLLGDLDARTAGGPRLFQDFARRRAEPIDERAAIGQVHDRRADPVDDGVNTVVALAEHDSHNVGAAQRARRFADDAAHGCFISRRRQPTDGIEEGISDQLHIAS